jgi:GNAT superfamily N-acetyltransferase
MQTITPATQEDIPQLCTLLAVLFTQEADFHADAEKQSAALTIIISRPATGCILVLRENTTIVGMISLLYTISTACGGQVALLEDMVVHPSRRNDGLGSQLLHAAIEQARCEGCMRITLLTDRANDPAIRFYQRQGFGLSEMIPLRLLFS